MQKNTTITISILTLIIGLGVGYIMGTSNNSTHTMTQKNNQQDSHVMPDGSMMHGDGDMSMTDMMNVMNAELEGKKGDDFDQSFLREMIIHHEGAVEMAKLALTNAKHQEIKDLAIEIIQAQDKEIAEMKSWQKLWFNE